MRARLLLLGCCLWGTGASLAAARIDPRQLIADSGALRKPEPEMTESEQAIHEKVAPIIARRPAFALKLLRAMSASADPDQKPSPAFEFMMGNARYAAGEYAAAEANYRNALGRNPTFSRAWNNLGVLLYVQNRYADAVPCFSRAVSLGDRDPATFGLLGNSFEKTGNTVSAEMAYTQALAADPANASWSEGLLRLAITNRQPARAETLVTTLLTRDPRDVRYWQTYAHVLLSRGKNMEAMALLERMSTLGLAREADVILLGDLYLDQRMLPEALATFTRVAAAQPELAERRLVRFAKVLLESRDWAQALTVLDALAQTRLTPQGRLASLESRAELEVRRQNWPEAKRAFGSLLAEAPASGNAWIGLGRVHLAEAEPTQATAAFERAQAIPESAYRASMELANLEFRNRNYARCLHYLDHALGLQRSASVANFREQVKRLVPAEKQSPP